MKIKKGKFNFFRYFGIITKLYLGLVFLLILAVLGCFVFLNKIQAWPLEQSSSKILKYNAGKHPSWLTSADFNRDGYQDVIATNAGDNTITILMGTVNNTLIGHPAKGTPIPGIDYAVGVNPVYVINADFNNNGYQDVAVANSGDNTISILLGNGDGTFEPAVHYDVEISPRSIAAADFDNNGKMDLAVANYGTGGWNEWGNITILMGNGDGTFIENTNSPIDHDIQITSVIAVDLDLDGIVDLAVTSYAPYYVSIFMGNGDGTFQAPVDYNLPLSNSILHIVSDDFNNDGYPDLATSNEGDWANAVEMSVLLNKGDGTFTDPFYYGNIEDDDFFDCRSITSVDLNGDNIKDLALACMEGGYYYVFLGNDNGTFNAPIKRNASLPAYNLSCLIPVDINNDGINYFVYADYYRSCTDISKCRVVGVIPDYNFNLLEISPPAVFAGSPGFKLTALGGRFDNNSVLRIRGNNRDTTLIDEKRLNAQILASDLTTFGDASIVIYDTVRNITSVSLNLSVERRFEEPFNFSVGTNPVAVFNGDFNNNKKEDVAVVNSAGNSVSILLGDGLGGLLPGNILSVGNNPTSVFSADFNNNRNKDLVVTNFADNTITILMGNGDGTFIEQSDSPFSVGSGPQAVYSADLNNNNIYDLVVVNSNDNTVTIFMGNGDGSFAEQVNSPISVGSQPQAVYVADFNADNKKDLVVANSGDDTVTILIGNGDGSFTEQINSPLGVGSQPQAVYVADFNADNKKDLVVANYGSNNISFLLGNGDGTFAPAVNYNVGSNPISLVGRDFTRDNKIDLAVVNWGGNSVSVLNGNGDGTFGLPVAYAVNSNPASIIAHDFNNNKTNDFLIVNSGSNNVSLLLGRSSITGTRTFNDAVNYNIDVFPTGLCAADFNNDNKIDLAASNIHSRVSVVLGKGDGTFFAFNNYQVNGDGLRDVYCADLNGDNFVDLVTVNKDSNNISILLGDGTGSFYEQAISPYAVGSKPVMVSVADFNNDDILDLAVVNNNHLFGGNNVSVLLGNGDGTFQTRQNYNVGLKPESVFSADLNNNGNIDLVTANYNSNNISILLNNGNGTFAPAVNINVGSQPRYVFAADFNNNNNKDLAVSNSGNNTVTILLGDGNGNFQQALISPIPVGNLPGAIIGGDFNDDNIYDLAVVNKDDPFRTQFVATRGSISVLFGHGNGIFDKPINYTVGLAPAAIASADFNNDKKNDLAVVNHLSWGDSLSILLRKTLVSRSPFFAPPSSPENLVCRALDTHAIRWTFEDKATNETGFRLYGQSGLIKEKNEANLKYIDETGFEPNSLAADRRVIAFNASGESLSTNKASCYTLASRPKAPIITIKIEGINIAINRTDGNPDYTEYAIFEYYTNKYAQADGSLAEEVVWQTYEQWGGSGGIDALVGDNYKIYILARNGDGKISGYSPESLNLDCKAQSSSEVAWLIAAPEGWEKEGFNLYRENSNEESGLLASISTKELFYEYTEPGLQPNTLYSAYFRTYNPGDDEGEIIESEASNISFCYTLANDPLPIIIGEITDEGIQIMIDPNDGNPPETLYAILESQSGKYVQADGSLGDEPVWQTYEQWGAVEGIIVKVAGDVSGEFRLSFQMAINPEDYSFVAYVQNGDGLITEKPEKLEILASKGVGVNLARSKTIWLSKTAMANNTGAILPAFALLAQEFFIFLNIILLVLIVLLFSSLYKTFSNLKTREKLLGKIKLAFKLMFHKPALVFDKQAPKSKEGIFLSSFDSYKKEHLNSQWLVRRAAVVICLMAMVLIVLVFSVLGLQHSGLAQENDYSQDGQQVQPGDELSYIIRFANQSNLEAKNINIRDNLDINLTYLTGSAQLVIGGLEIEGGCGFGNNELNCFHEKLLGQQRGFMTFKARVKENVSGATISNQAMVSGSNFAAVNTNIVNNTTPVIEFADEEPVEEIKFEEETAPAEETAPMPATGLVIDLTPVAADDMAETEANQAVVIAVLANDSDPENALDINSLEIIDTPQNGTAVINRADGTIIYTPDLDFSGQDSFGYMICNMSELCDTAAVFITVKQAEVKEVSMTGSFFNILTRDISKTQTGQNIITSITDNKAVKNVVESKPVKFANEKVLNNPAVEQVSRDVVTPVLVTVSAINTVPAVATVAVNFWSYLQFIFLEPFLIFFRKKRKNWGVVYDSLTKMPISLALVRLYEKKGKQLIQTKVTDLAGRYLLMVKNPGRYYLEVVKPGYDFPTRILRAEKQDTKYLDLYHGEEIEVKEKDAAISVNIPLDVREKKAKPVKEIVRNFYIRHLRLLVSYAGFVLAILVLIIYPALITIFALLIHLVFYMTFKKLLVPPKTKGWGIVYDSKNKEPLDNAVVRIFDLKFNKLLETQVTDKKGRYAFLVGKNVYQLLAEKSGYEPKEVKPVDLVKKDQIVNLDVGLDKA